MEVPCADVGVVRRAIEAAILERRLIRFAAGSEPPRTAEPRYIVNRQGEACLLLAIVDLERPDADRFRFVRFWQIHGLTILDETFGPVMP